MFCQGYRKAKKAKKLSGGTLVTCTSIHYLYFYNLVTPTAVKDD